MNGRHKVEQTLLLEQAIAKDSSFALAYSRLASSYVGLRLNVQDEAKAQWAIARSLALDSSNSEAYVALGLLREWMRWDWAASEAAFRRAITLNSRDGQAHHELGQLLMRMGRCGEALVEERRAMAVEPESIVYQSGIGEIYHYCRLFDDALRETRNGFNVREDSSHVYWDLAETYFDQGQYRTALVMYEKSGDPAPGWAYAALGSRTQALQEIAALQAQVEPGKSNDWTYWTLAKLHTSLGERAEAITWLERMYEKRSGLLVYLKVEPHFDPLRGEPRFQALMEKVGLPD